MPIDIQFAQAYDGIYSHAQLMLALVLQLVVKNIAYNPPLMCFQSIKIYAFILRLVILCLKNYQQTNQHIIFMEQLIDTSHTDNNLSALLEKGDRILDNILKKAILYLGKTRAGKSTAIHWTLSRPLIGVKDEYSGVAEYRSLQGEGPEISKSFFSCTLLPYVFNIEDRIGRKCSLVDMAGYDFNRDYASIATVSYMFKAILEMVSQVKFVVVVSGNILSDNNMKSAVETFIKFVEMFDMANMKDYTRKMIYDAVIIIVSKAEAGINFYTRLEELNEDYSKTKATNIQPFVMELLCHLCEKRKLILFPQAVSQKYADPLTCPLINKLEDEDWRYLDLNRKRWDYNDFIIFPYTFLDSPQQQNKFQVYISTKERIFQDFAKALGKLIQRCTEDDNWYKEGVEYYCFWQDMMYLLREHEIYENTPATEAYRLKKLQEKRTLDYRRPKSSGLFGVSLMNQLEIIYNTLCIQIDDLDSDADRYERIKEKIIVVIKALKETYCRTYRQECILLDLSYLFYRTCNELRMFHQMWPSMAINPTALTSKLNGIFLTKIQYLFGRFISEQTTYYKNYLRKHPQARSQMVDLIERFKKFSNPNPYKALIESYDFSVDINYIELVLQNAYTLFQEKNYTKAIQIVLILFETIFDYEKNYERANDIQKNQQMSEIQKRNIEIDESNAPHPETFNIRAYKVIGLCMVKFNNLRCIQTAKNVFEHINYIGKAMQCWEKIIELENGQLSKYNAVATYADFLKKYSRLERLFEIMQRAEIQAYDYKTRSEARQKLQAFQLNDLQPVKFHVVWLDSELNCEIRSTMDIFINQHRNIEKQEKQVEQDI